MSIYTGIRRLLIWFYMVYLHSNIVDYSRHSCLSLTMQSSSSWLFVSGELVTHVLLVQHQRWKRERLVSPPRDVTHQGRLSGFLMSLLGITWIGDCIGLLPLGQCLLSLTTLLPTQTESRLERN